MLLDTKDVRLRTFLLLGLDAGLRVGEVARLKVSDIDSKNMLLSIRNSKRGKSRKVPLSNALLNALRKYWIVYRPDKNGYLFPAGHSCSKNPYINQNYINMLFKTTLKIFLSMFQPCVSIILETHMLHLCSKTNVIYSL